MSRSDRQARSACATVQPQPHRNGRHLSSAGRCASFHTLLTTTSSPRRPCRCARVVSKPQPLPMQHFIGTQQMEQQLPCGTSSAAHSSAAPSMEPAAVAPAAESSSGPPPPHFRSRTLARSQSSGSPLHAACEKPGGAPINARYRNHGCPLNTAPARSNQFTFERFGNSIRR